MKDQITILIPTSPIPSHPSTAILDETIANCRKLTDTQIIIMFDGIAEKLKHRKDAYIEYFTEVMKKCRLGKYGDCVTVSSDEHIHQAIMTRFVLDKYIKTPLIMFCEHDTSPIGEIPFNEICEYVRDSEIINYIRFNIFEQIPEEHKHLIIGDPFYPEIVTPEGAKPFYGVRITRTIQYSQRPHIAKSNWYRQILNDHFKPNQKTMIEDVMHSVVQVAYDRQGRKDAYGLAIYTPIGNQLRSYHADGRGEDEKIIEA